MDYLAGMEKSANISTYGLSEEQVGIIKALAEKFRSQNNATKKEITSEQYEILGHIVVELSK